MSSLFGKADEARPEEEDNDLLRQKPPSHPNSPTFATGRNSLQIRSRDENQKAGREGFSCLGKSGKVARLRRLPYGLDYFRPRMRTMGRPVPWVSSRNQPRP